MDRKVMRVSFFGLVLACLSERERFVSAFFFSLPPFSPYFQNVAMGLLQASNRLDKAVMSGWEKVLKFWFFEIAPSCFSERESLVSNDRLLFRLADFASFAESDANGSHFPASYRSLFAVFVCSG